MKNKNGLSKKSPSLEVDESFNSLTLFSKKEREKSLKDFGEFLQKKRANYTEKEKQEVKLLTLKYQMQNYVSTPKYDRSKHFGYFLQQYIEMLNKKNKEFASDIHIKPTELSQLINRHRNPNDKILIRLELHSNKNIPAYFWYRIVEKEREHEIINNKDMRKQELKYVRNAIKIAS